MRKKYHVLEIYDESRDHLSALFALKSLNCQAVPSQTWFLCFAVWKKTIQLLFRGPQKFLKLLKFQQRDPAATSAVTALSPTAICSHWTFTPP